MIVAVIDRLIFKPNVHKHTVYYDKSAREFAFDDWRSKEGTFKAVVAEDVEDAVYKLSKQLKHFICDSWLGGNLNDFRFNIRYSVVENGEFWISPSTIPCKDYEIKES